MDLAWLHSCLGNRCQSAVVLWSDCTRHEWNNVGWAGVLFRCFPQLCEVDGVSRVQMSWMPQRQSVAIRSSSYSGGFLQIWELQQCWQEKMSFPGGCCTKAVWCWLWHNSSCTESPTYHFQCPVNWGTINAGMELLNCNGAPTHSWRQNLYTCISVHSDKGPEQILFWQRPLTNARNGCLRVRVKRATVKRIVQQQLLPQATLRWKRKMLFCLLHAIRRTRLSREILLFEIQVKQKRRLACAPWLQGGSLLFWNELQLERESTHLRTAENSTLLHHKFVWNTFVKS